MPPPADSATTVLIFGTGRMAAIRADALRAVDPDIRLVFSSRSAAYGQAMAERFGAVAYVPGGDGVPVDVDAAIVTSSTAHHPADTAEAVRLGVPTLCEKPLSLSVESARAMAEQAEGAGVNLHVAFHRRFDPAFAALRERVAAGELGTLYQLRTVSFDVAPSTPAFIAESGGIFRDLLVHDIESAIWTTGCDVVRVHATGTVRHWPDYASAGDFDVATALLWMSDGLVATVHATRHSPLGQDVRTEVVGSRTSLSAGLGPRTPVRAVEDGSVFAGAGFGSFQSRWARAFEAETAAFLAGARNGAAFAGATAREALRVQAVAEACVESARTGCSVDVSPT